ncbi:hypothetical protein CL652_02415 [bacterium]|nr:hypothetical protein [bacterium]|tara:strand:+ start:11641 stop:12264 length:624 start_codon:yes stop_codon:yes gene_type:complete
MPRTNTVTPPSFDELDRVGATFTQTKDPSLEGIDMQNVVLDSVWVNVFGFALVLSLALGIATIYAMLRTYQIRKEEKKYYANKPLSGVARRVFGIEGASAGSAHEMRWRSVVEHANSDNPNDWRQAILEADVMLDDVITSRGYTGEGIGEKMKQVERGDINSIDDAWEAHKIRNRVAHEGSNYQLSQRETRRVIHLYEKVFRELGHT